MAKAAAAATADQTATAPQRMTAKAIRERIAARLRDVDADIAEVDKEIKAQEFHRSHYFQVRVELERLLVDCAPDGAEDE